MCRLAQRHRWKHATTILLLRTLLNNPRRCQQRRNSGYTLIPTAFSSHPPRTRFFSFKGTSIHVIFLHLFFSNLILVFIRVCVSFFVEPSHRYLVEEYGLSLTDRDDFGSTPLHWAVLHGHLDTVRWIALYTRQVSARANWSKAFDRVRGGRE